MGCSSKTTIELSIPFPPCDNLSSPCSSAIFLLTCSLVGSYALSSLHKLPPANNSKSSAEAASQCGFMSFTFPPNLEVSFMLDPPPPRKEDGLLASIKKELEQLTTFQNIVENGFWSSQLVNPIDITGNSSFQTQATSRWFLFLPKSTESKPATTCISWGFRSCCFVVTTGIVPGPKKNEELETTKGGSMVYPNHPTKKVDGFSCIAWICC